MIPLLMSYQIQFFTISSPLRPTGRLWSRAFARLRQRISELESVRLRQRIAELGSTRLRQRIGELESKFGDGVSISVPDSSSSYATVSESPLLARVDLPLGLVGLSQVQSPDHGQGLSRHHFQSTPT